jgi:hypothetical protein
MSQYPAMTNAPVPAAPTLAANVMHFARLLRRAGLPVGPAETLAAQQALSLIELGSKAETRTALRAVMTHRHEHQEVFDQAFALFWRDPTAAEQAAAMALLEAQKEKKLERPPPASRRVAEAMQQKRDRRDQPKDEPPVQDAVLTVSDQERLQRMDFEAMSAEEIAAAKQEIRRLSLPLDRRNPQHRAQPPADPRAAAGGAVRHFRLDVALRPDPAAFPARRDE